MRAAERSGLASRVRLEPGATCLRWAELESQLARRLDGADVTVGLVLEVLGDPKFSRFVTIRVLRAGAELAERRFEPGPAGCEDLHAAVAMAVALACKAVRDSSAAGSDQPVVAGPTRAPGWQLTLALLGGAHVLPGLQLGGRLGVAWAWSDAWRVLLAATGLHAPARALTAPGELEASAITGRLQLCAALADAGHLQASACAGPEAGAIWAAGRGYAPSRRAGAAYAALAADLEARFGLVGRWSLRGGLGISLPLSRPRFVARDARGALAASEVLPALGISLALGLSYQF